MFRCRDALILSKFFQKICVPALTALLIAADSAGLAGNLAGGQPGAGPPPGVQKAVQLYNSGNYSKALSILDAVSAAEASNPYTRYYKALCCQSLNQLGAAEKEFYWLYQFSPNADLKYKAWQGLKALEQYKNQRGSAGQRNNSVGDQASKSGPSHQAGSTSPKIPDPSAAQWTTPGAGYGATGDVGQWSQEVIARPKACSRR